MSNYNSLKATIDANIKQNGNQEITGQILNSVLNAMVTTLGTGYQFAGVATIATNPGTPDAKVFYIANGKGTYEKFGGLEVTEDDVVVFYWDTAWHKVATGIASNEKLTELASGMKFKDSIDYTQEQVWTDDNGIYTYVKINQRGIFAKQYFNIDGTDAFANVRNVMHILKTDTEIDILEKLLTCLNIGNYDVYWETGTYIFSNIYIYMRDTLGWTWTMELPIGNNCRYYFNNSTIISNAPDGEYNTTRNVFGCKAGASIKWGVITIIPDSYSYELHDGSLIINGGTYCVHDEMNQNTSFYKHVYENMRMEYNEGIGSENISKCIGGGAGCNGLIVIKDCSFITNETEKTFDNNVTWHASNNTTDPETMAYFVNNCYFSKGFRVGGVTAEKTSFYYVKFSNNSVATPQNININADEKYIFNNEIRN